MSNHGLTRNPDNEPVCLCGYRPAILDEPAPVGKQWKARTAVLDHAAGLNEALDLLRTWDDVKTKCPSPPVRSPDAPFIVPAARYPRAGVRPTLDGRWHLTLWDSPDVQHELPEPVFDDLGTAFDYGWLTIGACRQSGTNLNGMEAA